jgi:hypothetical protein
VNIGSEEMVTINGLAEKAMRMAETAGAGLILGSVENKCEFFC